ncbi:MAG TPA: hypothetical protein VFI28_02550 [Candidatus Limnocylindrales bacterium]|nr:hypothetical protein [Candidatus Limnocylindrales bacterium]
MPLLLAGIGPIGLAVPVGLILGWWLAPSAAAADRLPLGTIAAMALAAVVLGDALMAIGTVIALPALAPDGSPVRSDHTCL